MMGKRKLKSEFSTQLQSVSNPNVTFEFAIRYDNYSEEWEWKSIVTDNGEIIREIEGLTSVYDIAVSKMLNVISIYGWE